MPTLGSKLSIKELQKLFGQGYEILVEQDSSKALNLIRKLQEKNIEGSWYYVMSRDKFLSPNNDVDFRQFVIPGVYSPIEKKEIPVIQLAARFKFDWRVLTMPWEARNYIDAPFEKIYGGRFALAKLLDYRNQDSSTRNCGDEDDAGCR